MNLNRIHVSVKDYICLHRPKICQLVPQKKKISEAGASFIDGLRTPTFQAML